MKRTVFFVWLIAAILFLICGCKKVPQNDREPGPGEWERGIPSFKPKGEPMGAPVKKLIGTDGGSITSEDDNLQVSIPRGSFAEATEVSIQPISNTLEEGSGRNAYRIEAQGKKLLKPVTLTFNYEDRMVTEGAEKVLMIAYQRADGAWCAKPTSVNTESKTVTVTTSHFSDWMFFEDLTLRKNRELVEKKDQVELDLLETSLLAPLTIPGNGDADALPLSLLQDLEPTKYTTLQWKIVEGPGKLEVRKNTKGVMAKALYTAPEIISESKTVTIQVEVTSKGTLPDPGYPGGKRPIGKMLFLTSIKLSPDSYFKGTVGGKPFNFDLTGARVRALNLQIDGRDTKAGTGINIYCNGLKGTVYNGGKGAGEFYMTYGEGTPRVMFWSYYQSCSEGEQFSGKLTLTNSTDDFVEGNVTGTVFFIDNRCGFTESKELSGSFKVAYYDAP
ncbi:hypothetical protein [Niabella sp.]|uniref:hypothetical protein n=1 Tax=Niabella sp. TaxID=1962976 RepID=UPI00262F1EB6|nr:hypothetical protein [Niabella sp.]